ncbi:MFS general substrate transporter [Annulohypoxylon truncatum]|uniref:MFS general substrate transporter n=1 Tax=Annulohypoxylon truncatum TaxID=327061 RepID=UPI002008AE45|nr:MFS general substrate transporter [Annulohypoxylon truncatum]KAI1211704.1 MFS general substrate transporter [Annulohypoxylon truncatum]
MALFRRKHKQNLYDIATQPSVFDDPERARYFQPAEDYENIHRFDPEARWTWAEELPLVSKLDWNIMLWAWIAFFAMELQRSDLTQANTDNFLDNLGMSTDDYNMGNTIFKLAYICAGLPSQLISKKVGHHRWIPTLECLWSVVMISQFWMDGRTTFLTCRVLLGLLQGGFCSIIVLYLSYFFKGTELSFRLAILYTSMKTVHIVAPILAFGILRLRGYQGLEGWRWLFLIEGLFNLAVGIWSWFMMVPSPTQTRSWYRPKGWFSEREEVIMINRLLRDDPSKGDMNNRQAINLKKLWQSLCDFDLWPIYIAGFVFPIPYAPSDQYLSLTLRGFGFDTFDSNLLTVPSQLVGIFTMLIPTYLSEAWNQRSLMGLFAQIWVLPNIIALAVLPSGTSQWVKYAVVSVLLSEPYLLGMHAAWCSRNSNAVRARTVSAAVFDMSHQLAGIVYSNIYRTDDKPEYRRGNKQLVAVCASNIVIYILIKLYYIWRNKQKESEWSAMTREEQLLYLQTTTDQGNKRKDFRFVH